MHTPVPPAPSSQVAPFWQSHTPEQVAPKLPALQVHVPSPEVPWLQVPLPLHGVAAPPWHSVRQLDPANPATQSHAEPGVGHVKLVSTVAQSAEQPSPPAVLPSSHTSPPVTLPSPQTGGTTTPSKAPASQPVPGRAVPRWSTVTGAEAISVHDPLSIAALPASSPIVRVGPPLAASGPTLGSSATWSPEPPLGQPAPLWTTLVPAVAIAAAVEQLLPVLALTIVLLMVSGPAKLCSAPAPARVVVLPTMVQWLTCTGMLLPLDQMAPPSSAVFPLNVLLAMTSASLVAMPPPSPVPALLSAISQRRTVKSSPLLWMPPPPPSAVLPLTAQSVTTSALRLRTPPPTPPVTTPPVIVSLVSVTSPAACTSKTRSMLLALMIVTSAAAPCTVVVPMMSRSPVSAASSPVPGMANV